jgi:hypothetical protein
VDTAVALVKSYLELCGYFVLAELPVRANHGAGYQDVTDIDVIAVRFPHPPAARSRPADRPLDVFLGVDPVLGTSGDGVDVVIGEVKEGQARVNPALVRDDTIVFALRRLGCCPEHRLDEEARLIRHGAGREMSMPGGVRCRVRLVAFAGHGVASDHGVQTVSLNHCVEFIGNRLREARDVLSGTQFKDPVLGLFAFQDKLVFRTGTHSHPGSAG